jgi:hypothetical protein
LSDIAAGLTQSLSKDGQTTWTGNQNAGGSYKLTNLAAGTAATDAAILSQVQSGTAALLGGVGGTPDVITASASPAIAAYVAGQTFRFISTGANTGAVTINLNGLGARSITKQGTTALVAGDIPSNVLAEIVYDGTQFQLVNCISSTPTFSTLTVNGTANVGGNAVVGATPLFQNARALQVVNLDPDALSSASSYIQTNAGLLQLVMGTTAGGGAASVLCSASGVFNVYTTQAQSLQLGTNNVPGQVVIDSSGNVNVVNGRLRQDNTNVFCRDNMAESAELGIANNTKYTFAHSLGAIPKLVMAVLRCKTAEFGYAINDEVAYATTILSGSNTGLAIWSDATNVYAQITSSAANNLQIPRVSSNDLPGITYANWRIVLRAWY